MSNYSIALFLHIVGALGFFVVLGLEWIGLSQIRSARLPEEVHAIMGIVKSTNRLGFVSMLTTVITGLYMLLTVWHRLSQDRQAGFRRVHAHHRCSDYTRPCLSTPYTSP